VAPFRLAELAALGPYFALQSDDGSRAGWRPVTGLIDDRAELGQVIDGIAARLGAAPQWIAASVFYQGWAARLTSIYAGSVVLGGAVPDLAATSLRYLQPASGPVELLAAPLTAVDAGAGFQRLLGDHLDPLAAAVRRQVRIGRHLLLGNLASALAGSVVMLSHAGHGQHEDLISRAWAQPAELARYGRWHPATDGLRYVRTTCCGYDQLSSASRCSDCSLSRRRYERKLPDQGI
jgi:hypothetical protein